MKFYDVIPVNGFHCLCADGEVIARYDDLAKAQAAREAFIAPYPWPSDEELARIEHFGRYDEPINKWERDEYEAEYQDWERNQ
jgi:hypothetical protein